MLVAVSIVRNQMKSLGWVHRRQGKATWRRQSPSVIRHWAANLTRHQAKRPPIRPHRSVGARWGINKSKRHSNDINYWRNLISPRHCTRTFTAGKGGVRARRQSGSFSAHPNPCARPPLVASSPESALFRVGGGHSH